MKIKVPEYFNDFKCIADRCEDSCCIGWEIDVDDAARRKYSTLDTPLGREILEKTSHGSFPTLGNGRCAFLDECGLCRIISEAGEEYLCDICREHPRYYNRVGEVTEGGLGLGCEEAARIVLSLGELPRIEEIEHSAPELDTDAYSDVTQRIREELFSSIFTEEIWAVAGLYIAYAEAADALAFDLVTSSDISLTVPKLTPVDVCHESLDDCYRNMLGLIGECDPLDTVAWEGHLSELNGYSIDTLADLLDSRRGLLYYFTHRYVVGGIEDMTVRQRILFALAASLTVAGLGQVYREKTSSHDPDVRAAVAFSKNIEYSLENIDYILTAE